MTNTYFGYTFETKPALLSNIQLTQDEDFVTFLELDNVEPNTNAMNIRPEKDVNFEQGFQNICLAMDG